MSAISLKSITGITSITTPAGVDNQLTLHTNDTTQRVKVTQSGIEVVGVATFQDIDVDGHTNLDNGNVAGIVTFNSGSALHTNGGQILLFDRPDGNSNNLFFGTGGKAVAYHDGTGFSIVNNTGHAYIGVGAGSKDLYLYAQTSGNVLLQQNTGVRYVKGVGSDASVQLFFNNNLRLNTTTAGVSIPKDLDVDGHTNLDNVSIAGVTTAAGSIVQTSGHTQLRSFSNPTSGAGMEMGYDGTRGVIQCVDRDNSSNKTLFLGGGNVGINQVNPTARLDVNGGIKVAGTLDANGDLDVDGHTNLDNVSIAGVATVYGTSSYDILQLRAQDTNGIANLNIYSNGTTGHSRILFSDTAASSGDGYINYSHTDRALTFTTAGTSNERLRLTSGGQVRIGNANNLALWGQNQRLQVAGSGSWSDSGITIACMSTTGQTPNLVFGASRGATPGTALNNGDRLGYISFVGDDGTDMATVGAAIVSGTDAAASSNSISGTLQFYTGGNQSSNERLRITSDGKIGVDVSAPKSRLHLGASQDIRIGGQYGGMATMQQQVQYSSGYTGTHWQFKSYDSISWSFDGVLIVHGTGGSSYGSEVVSIKIVYSRESGDATGDIWRNGTSDYNIETLGHSQIGLAPSTGSLTVNHDSTPGGNTSYTLLKLGWSSSGQNVGVWSKLIGNFYWASPTSGDVEIQDKDGNIVFNSNP